MLIASSKTMKEETKFKLKPYLSSLALLTSTSTLICCAIPIMLVSIGLGTVVATLATEFPFLITLSEYKLWLFAVSGGLLVISAWLLWFTAQSCPADPMIAQKCLKLQIISRLLFWIALIIWTIGFFAAFLLMPIQEWLNLNGEIQ